MHAHLFIKSLLFVCFSCSQYCFFITLSISLEKSQRNATSSYDEAVVEVTGRRRRSTKPEGGMEIPCILTLRHAEEKILHKAKELLVKERAQLLVLFFFFFFFFNYS